MAKSSPFVGGVVFYCTGCEELHHTDRRWTFNGDHDRPTLTPSLITDTTKGKCHLFVRDGQIQYLDDSWHELRGITVNMRDVDEFLR